MSKIGGLLFIIMLLITLGCGGKTTEEESFDEGTTTSSGTSSGAGSGAVGGTELAGLTGTGGGSGEGESPNEAMDGGGLEGPADGGRRNFDFEGGRPNFGFEGGRPDFNLDGGRPDFNFEGGRPDFNVDGGRRPNRPQTVPIEQTPEAVQTTIEAELENATIDNIQQQDEGGAVIYEVDAEVDGYDIEITIAEDGTVLRKEEDIDPTSLPEAVTTRITETVGDIEVRRATKVTDEEQVTYQIRATSAEGERISLTIAEDGTLIENGGR